METDGERSRERGQIDSPVLDNLYQKYQTTVFAFAYYLSQNRAEAEDLFQEAWLRIARNLPEKVNMQSIKSWIFTIVANLYRDALRKKRVRRLFFLQKSMMNDRENTVFPSIPGTSTPDLSEEVFHLEIARDINRAIANLPERQRRVFVLKEIAGFKQAEISDILRIPLGTVKSLMYRAVKRLQRELSKYRPRLNNKENQKCAVKTSSV
jgi:RNA polymerase sigma-70 factor (ECF subfamily)